MVNIKLKFFCDDIMTMFIGYLFNVQMPMSLYSRLVLPYLKDRMNEARVISLRRGKAMLIRLDQTTEIILNLDTTNK